MTASFFRALYPDAEHGTLVLFTLPDSRSHAFPVSEVDAAARTAVALADRCDVYFGVGLQGSVPTGGKRGGAEGVVALPGLWLDLDLRTPYRDRVDLPATVDEATELLDELPLPPTAIIDSGGGLYPWWVFNELWTFPDNEERDRAASLSKGWQGFVLAMAKRRGWKLDATHDLARILRVPGTLNHKGVQPVPVRILRGGGPRYNPHDFEDFQADPPDDPQSGEGSDYLGWIESLQAGQCVHESAMYLVARWTAFGLQEDEIRAMIAALADGVARVRGQDRADALLNGELSRMIEGARGKFSTRARATRTRDLLTRSAR